MHQPIVTNKRTAWVLAAAAALTITACARSGRPELSAAHFAAPPAAAAPGTPAAPGTRVVGPRLRVVQVEISLRVRSIPDTVASMRRAVAQHEGYVETASASFGASRGGAFVARVPAAQLEAFRSELAHLGVVEREHEGASDVTEQHADLDARLRNARAEETRLLAILDGRTGSLADVLAVEQAIARVREQVEQLDAQQRGLADQIAYARIEAALTEEAQPTALLAAARDGLATARDVGVGLLVFGLRAGPTLAIFGLFVVAVFWSHRRVVAYRARPSDAVGATAAPGGKPAAS